MDDALAAAAVVAEDEAAVNARLEVGDAVRSNGRSGEAENPNVAARLELDPGAREEFYAYYRRLTPIGYANALRALLAMDHITDELPKIRVPVLLVGGDRDPSLGPMKVLHRKVKGSRLVVLSPASHFANRDQPEPWTRAVLDFLAHLERT